MSAAPALAALPEVLNHQGRIAVNGVNFDGNGQFKFALVNANGSTTYWSNDGSSLTGAEPASAVTLAVSKGLYSVLLGDTTLANMEAITPGALEQSDAHLRVWFNDGIYGFQQITPDQRLAAVPYAIHANKALAAGSFSGPLEGDVTGAQNATAIADATVTGKRLTGFTSGTGPLSGSDSLLAAIGKLDGNSALKAPLDSPSFTGTVAGLTAEMVGLGNVANTADADKPVSTAQQAALDLKAPLNSPTFTGTVNGLTAEMVGLGNVDDTSDLDKPVSTAQQSALDLKVDVTALDAKNDQFLAALSGKADVAALDAALNEKADVADVAALNIALNGKADVAALNIALNGKADVAALDGKADVAALDTKAPHESPTFSGTVSGITQGMVGLGEVDNTNDLDKPISTAQQSALNLKVDLTALGAKADITALDAKAPLADPTFTGTVSGVTPDMVGLGEVDDTSDLDKPVSTAQQSALDLKVDLTALDAKADITALDAKADITALDAKAPLANPIFTGTVSGIIPGMVGLGNVDNTSDTNKPVSTAQQAAFNAQQSALDGKAPLEAPEFTGTVTGITGAMVGLGNVNNTSDADKPVSTAQQTEFLHKADTASPTFTGTVVLPGGSTAAAPLRFISGSPLEAPVFGAVEFDGASLYLTTNAASPVRKTLAFSEDVISEVSLSSITAAPAKPVVAWGENGSGQTNTPALANVAAVAAGEAHSLALLDDGTVVAWGLNTSNQTTIPAGLAGVTQISAGAYFNLVRKNDGTVAAWGANDYGQTILPGGITTATQVAAGMNHGLALLANGSVMVWGDNTFGQTTVPTLANVIAIAAGYDHCLALKSDGTVVAWGRNQIGQVTLPDGLSDITAIAAGAYHSLALKSDGTVVAWGWNNGGQVTLPAGLTNVVKIAGGYGFSMALKTDGSVVAWGDNSATQTTVPSSASLVTHIAAGASHALALRADSIPAQVARLDQDNVFTGKVGIGRTPAVNALEVAGNASKSTMGNWLANSDRRIKTGIKPITGALETLSRVRLVDFRYTPSYLTEHPAIEDRRYPNVIAQEFAEIFPSDVKESGEIMPDGSSILQVDTYPLTIYSAAAIQELHRENNALKEQVAAQERRLRKLEEAVSRFEQ